MDAKPTTFRVRRVPQDQSITTLAGFLQESIDGLGDDFNITVRSLAPSPVEWNASPTCIATIEFAKIPARFLDGEEEWTVYLKRSHKFLLFDKNFRGFTPLNNVRSSQHEFDCLAVSGLGGHPFGSWRQKGRSGAQQFMWLRDQFPEDFPKFRVMIYGYDTDLADSESHQSLDDLARTFVQHLKLIGRAEYSAKPCVIFAHSLGGILVKRALYYMARSGDQEDFVLQKIRLAVFFGVPNRGMQVSHLLSMVKGRPNEALVNTLSTDSAYLNMLDEGFAGIAAFRSMRIISAYETKRSPTTVMNERGKWERCGDREILVGRESAIQVGSRNPRDVFHIDNDHSNMVKLAPDDVTYFVIRKQLQDALIHVNGHFETTEICQNSTPASTSALTAKSLGSNTNKGQNSGRQHHDMNIEIACADETCSICSYQEKAQTFRLEKSTARNVIDLDEELLRMKATLEFPEKDLRYEAITDAFPSSYGWLWKKDLRLMDWLLKGTGVYWIRGKPGSGKSTLMKYLYNEEKLRQELRGTSQIDLWFFFNERGDYLQKTFEGLLRTILYELVKRDSGLAQHILDVYFETPRNLRRNWNITELRKAFTAVLEQNERKVELLIFLDALDEYHGFPEAIAEWIRDVTKSSNRKASQTSVKVCFSSRPWDAFIAKFSKAPGFVLHEHTVQDIRQYAQAKVRPLCSQRSRSPVVGLYWHSIPAHKITDAIANMAEGVFLWVRLAIGILAQQDHCDSDLDFEKLLRKLPSNLEGFYARTLDRIPQNNRFEAFVLLEIVYRSPRSLNIEQLCLAAECARSNNFRTCQGLIQSKKASLSSSVDAQRHLLNFCAGLLECVKTGNTKSPYVQYIHRTAKDFVGSPGFAERLLGQRHDMQLDNGYTYLFRYTVAADTSGENPDDELLMLARSDEMTTGRPETTFIDSIPDDYFTYSYEKLHQSVFRCGYPSRFAFAVLADLKLYVRSTLSKLRAKDITSMARISLLPAIAWRALHCRVPMYRDGFDTERTFHLYGMWSMILNVTNDPQKTGENGLCAWDILMAADVAGSACIGISTSDDAVVRLVEILLEHGKQSLDAWVRYSPATPFYLETPSRVDGYSSLDAASKHSLPLASPKLSVIRIRHTTQTLGALHISDVKMSKVLLRYGADPNAFDAYGHTPLDVTVLTLEKRSAKEMHDKMILLATHGGCVTMTGAKFWYESLQILKSIGLSLSASNALYTVPLLQSDNTPENIARLESQWKRDGSKKVLLAGKSILPTPAPGSSAPAAPDGLTDPTKKVSRTRRFLRLFKGKD